MKASHLGYSLLTIALVATGVAGGFWLGHERTAIPAEHTDPKETRAALYWFDPMYPAQHFEGPGKSPFMDMDLVPRYADSTQDTASINVAAQITQSLGMRTSTVVRAQLRDGLEAVGSLTYNQREIATLQARSAGFVERVYARAPGDVLPAGTALADLLMPEWSAAQLEFIAVLNSEDARLIDASRERLRLLGMPASLIANVVKTREARPVQTVVTPIAGELQSLELRAGMAVSAGQNLASINGLSSVWLDASIPESQASSVALGSAVRATLSAYPGEVLQGRVIALLPSADIQTRTLTVRAQLPNPSGKLRPGMFASVYLKTPEQHSALLIPSEAVIRTGKRSLVMLAESAGRYQPQEIHTGREADGLTEVLDGLTEGQQVVTSGQFLLDSEASLRGIVGEADTRTTIGPASSGASQ